MSFNFSSAVPYNSSCISGTTLCLTGYNWWSWERIRRPLRWWSLTCYPYSQWIPIWKFHSFFSLCKSPSTKLHRVHFANELLLVSSPHCIKLLICAHLQRAPPTIHSSVFVSQGSLYKRAPPTFFHQHNIIIFKMRAPSVRAHLQRAPPTIDHVQECSNRNTQEGRLGA